MSRIRKLYYFDKKDTEEMISFLNNSENDAYISKIMFNPFLILHHFLPLSLKFLPESFILKDKNITKGLITVAPTNSPHRKVEIQKLFFEENSYHYASELVQYVVAKYKALGALSIIVKVDSYLPELLAMFVSKCGFCQISYEKLWRIDKFIDSSYDKKNFRLFRNSDAQAITNLYNDSLLPHIRPLLCEQPEEFREKIFKGLSYFIEYKYVIEDYKTHNIIGCISIKSYDNENFVIDVIQSNFVELDINAVISFASDKIKKRKKRFGLFIQTKRYTNFGEKYETIFKENNFQCVQNRVVLTNSTAQILRETSSDTKYTVISEYCPNSAIPTTKNVL